jgi:hypothetical protein
MQSSARKWSWTPKSGTFAAARLSRDDVAPSSAVRQPVIPNLRRATCSDRAAYTILSTSKIFCHPAENIFVRGPDAR